MTNRKKQEEETTIKIETTNSVKAIIVDCLTRKVNASNEIKKLNEEIKSYEEKLNSVLISYMEGKGSLLEDYNIIEYCNDGKFIVIEKRVKDE